jgi:polyribonucleotide nucleotidyltransferase
MPPGVRPPFALRLSLDVLSSDGDPSGAALAAACRAMASAGAPMPREVGSAAAAALRVRGGGGGGGGGSGGGGGPSSSSSSPGGGKEGESDSWEILVDPDAIEASSAAASFAVSSTSKGWTAGRLEAWSPGSLGAPASVVADGLRAAGAAAAARAAAADARALLAPRARGRFGAVGLPKDQVGKVIGVGGGVSRALEARTGGLLAVVDVEGDAGGGGRNATGRRGSGSSSSSSSPSSSPPASAEARYYAPDGDVAVAMEAAVGNLTGSNVVAGESYKVRVVGLAEYGAFVEFDGGFQALLHISEVAHARIHSVAEELSAGQEIDVLCTGRDARGLVQVSRRALLPGGAPAAAAMRPTATPFSSSPPPPPLSPPAIPRRSGNFGDFSGSRRTRSSGSGGTGSSRRSGERSGGKSTGGGDRGGDRDGGSRRPPPSSSSSPERRHAPRSGGGAAAAAASPSSLRRSSPVDPSKPEAKKTAEAAEGEKKGGGGILGGLFSWGDKKS